MYIESLLRFGTAAHFTYLVESPYSQRGGIFLVAAPGNMKTTIVKRTLEQLPCQLSYGDLTVKQLQVVRNQISNGIYHTLGFHELEKIYARQLSVALNFEGAIKAMVEEGFSHFAFEDQRCWVPTARCYVYASVLDSLYRQHFARWMDNGFLRRFITIKYQLSAKSKEKMRRAMHEGELVPFPPLPWIPSQMIKMDITKEESLAVADILGNDDATYTPFNLSRKILSILKWYSKQEPRRRRNMTPLEYMLDLKQGISSMGGTLEI
jgi:hypothetical protein